MIEEPPDDVHRNELSLSSVIMSVLSHYLLYCTTEYLGPSTHPPHGSSSSTSLDKVGSPYLSLSTAKEEKKRPRDTTAKLYTNQYKQTVSYVYCPVADSRNHRASPTPNGLVSPELRVAGQPHCATRTTTTLPRQPGLYLAWAPLCHAHPWGNPGRVTVEPHQLLLWRSPGPAGPPRLN